MNRTTAFPVIVGITLVLTLGGCATRIHTPPSGPSQLINFPELNAKSEAEVGQSMVSTAKLVVLPAIVIDKDITHNTTGWKLLISQGVLPMHVQNKEGTFYQMEKPVALTTLGVKQPSTIGGVFVPNDKSKSTEVYWDKVRKVHPGIDFKLATYEKWGVDSFKRELVYSGISQNTLSILYREFIDGTARPAFSQELKYDLSQGNTIGYKGARFQVIKATNTSIQYKVLKHLD